MVYSPLTFFMLRLVEGDWLRSTAHRSAWSGTVTRLTAAAFAAGLLAAAGSL